MKYRLLDNQTGVILERNPILLKEKLRLSFAPATGKMMVGIENQGVFYYRRLQDGCCELDAGKLQGVVKITLADTAFGSLQKRITCEELFVEHTDKGIWVYPNDGNLPQIAAQLRVENDNMRRSFAALEKKFNALEKRFECMMEGYDVT